MNQSNQRIKREITTTVANYKKKYHKGSLPGVNKHVEDKAPQLEPSVRPVDEDTGYRHRSVEGEHPRLQAVVDEAPDLLTTHKHITTGYKIV